VPRQAAHASMGHFVWLLLLGNLDEIRPLTSAFGTPALPEAQVTALPRLPSPRLPSPLRGVQPDSGSILARMSDRRTLQSRAPSSKKQRAPRSLTMRPTSLICSDACVGAGSFSSQYASNGACNDGGSGSEFSSCAYGTDCTDCGPRPVRDIITTSTYPPHQPPPSPSPPPSRRSRPITALSRFWSTMPASPAMR